MTHHLMHWSLLAGVVFAWAGAATLAVAEETHRVPERSEIEKQYRWATETIFASDAEWEQELKKLEGEVPRLAEYKGKLSESPEHLLKALTLRDMLEPRLARVYVYASLKSDQDTRVGQYQGFKARVRQLFVDYGAATAWLVPELTSMPYETIQSWMHAVPALGLYRHHFDDLFRQKAHILSAREEELLALTGQVRAVPGTAYGLLANADLQFPTIKDPQGDDFELSDSVFYKCMRDPDRDFRARSYEGIVGSYKGMRNTAAALLNGAVQSHILTVKARGYDSCLQAALDGGNIPVDVYNNLITTVNDNLPLLHRYQQIRQRALKLDDGVHAYDLFAPFVGDAKLEYSYEEAIQTIKAALQPLGPDYLRDMSKGFDSRWVDVFPTKGKRSGAYSSGTYLTQPYILLNFHGEYDSVSTLAHEMGHSMHSFYSRGTQPYVLCGL